MTLVRLDKDTFLDRRRRKYLKRSGAIETADEVVFAQTADACAIAISVHRARRREPHPIPVMLVHGLGANRFAYDLDPRVSLPAHLASQGWNVYTVELRGHGRSQKVHRGRRWGWGTDEYVKYDLPAAITAVLQDSGALETHAIGHSMGGILLHAACAAGETRLRSVLTLASALDYSGTPSVFHSLKKLVGLTRVLPAVPLGPMTRFLWPIALAVPNKIDAVNVHAPNVDKRLYRRLVALAFHAISSPVLRSLSKAMEGGLSASGASIDTPFLSICGTRDPQCHPDAAARGVTKTIVMGRDCPCEHAYGHFDLLMGRNVEQEVWPLIRRWLHSSESPRPTSPPSAPT